MIAKINEFSFFDTIWPPALHLGLKAASRHPNYTPRASFWLLIIWQTPVSYLGLMGQCLSLQGLVDITAKSLVPDCSVTIKYI